MVGNTTHQWSWNCTPSTRSRSGGPPPTPPRSSPTAFCPPLSPSLTAPPASSSRFIVFRKEIATGEPETKSIRNSDFYQPEIGRAADLHHPVSQFNPPRILIRRDIFLIRRSLGLLERDLNHTNQHIVGLAHCALGNIGSVEMARDLALDVERLLQLKDPNIRKKDLNHTNQYIVVLLLCALGNICSTEVVWHDRDGRLMISLQTLEDHLYLETPIFGEKQCYAL